jgi:hypothetical protein
MGQSTSIVQKNIQETMNDISQISRQHCINACTASQNVEFVAIDSDLGNITFDTQCYISGASCNLKASLDSSLINRQASEQVGDISREDDLFTIFSDFARIGSRDSITQENYQKIVNSITQDLFQLCENRADAQGSFATFLLRTKTKDININNVANVNNTQCTLINMSKSYVENDQDNSQDASISRTGSLSGLFGLLAVIFIGIFVIAGIGIFGFSKAGQKAV